MKLKKIIFLFGGLFFLMNAQAQLKTPPASSFQTIKQSFGLSEINLEYSRPNANGRAVFGELVPFGKIWRTGANASTTISFGDDVTINGKPLAAGTYSLLSIPGAKSWEILFNTDTKLGGNVAAYDEQKEVARVTAQPMNSPLFFETFTIQFLDVKASSAKLTIAWENTLVQLDIETEIDTKIMANIDEAIKGEKPPYYQAAAYYYDNNKDLNKAYNWVQKAAEQSPKAFWIQALKARIELKQNNKIAAAQTANKVIQLAGEAKNQDYVTIGKKLLAEANK